MSTTLVTLGSFSFVGFESPQYISLVTRQKLITHHLASGGAIVDSLGQDCQMVTFRGTFSGAGATARIQALNYMKSSGKPQVLCWSSNKFSVLIKEFELHYISDLWVPYKLSCSVIAPNSASSASNLDICGTPDNQLNAISALLLDTNVSMTPTQTNALVRLASQNYDAAPSDALQQVQQLLATLSTQIDDAAPQSAMATGVETVQQAVTRMMSYTLRSGMNAAFTLAYDRVAAISTCAQNISQS